MMDTKTGSDPTYITLNTISNMIEINTDITDIIGIIFLKNSVFSL